MKLSHYMVLCVTIVPATTQPIIPSLRLKAKEVFRACAALNDRLNTSNRSTTPLAKSDNDAQVTEKLHAHKAVEKSYKKQLRKTIAWGLSACNGLTYTIGIAKNADLLQPFLGDCSDIVVAAACYTALTAYGTHHYAQKARALYQTKKLSSHDSSATKDIPAEWGL